MGKLSIDGISKNIFKTASNRIEGHQQVESNQTNPFGVSFKGNVLTADVFDSPSKANVSFSGLNTNLISKAKGKIASSAMVASITKMSDAIGSRLNTVLNFGRKITGTISNTWQKARDININSETMTKAKNVVMNKLSEPVFTNDKISSKLDVGELRNMMKSELELAMV